MISENWDYIHFLIYMSQFKVFFLKQMSTKNFRKYLMEYLDYLLLKYISLT